MAKGWSAVEQAAAAQAEGGSFTPYLKINASEPGPKIIRILEQGEDVNTFPVHGYKIGPAQKDYRSFTCQSEYGLPCPGCAIGLKTSIRTVLNVIERNRPQIMRGADGFAIKDPATGQYKFGPPADEVVVASVGQPTGNMLREKDSKWRGLMTRDWEVKFSGTTTQSWTLEPADPTNAAGEPASENDKLLFAKKYNLDEYMYTSPEEAAEIVRKYCGGSPQGGGFGGQTGGFQGAPQQQPATQFAAPQQAAPAPAVDAGGFGGAVAQPSAAAPAQEAPAAPPADPSGFGVAATPAAPTAPAPAQGGFGVAG